MSSGHSRRVRTTHHRPRYTARPFRGYDSLHAILRMIRDRLPELPNKADSGEYKVVTDVIEWRSQVRHGRIRFLEGRSWLTIIATGRQWIAITPYIPRRSARSRSAMMRWDDQSPRTALRHCRRLNGERRRSTGNPIRIAAAEDVDRDPPVRERRAISGETQASRGSRRRDEGPVSRPRSSYPVMAIVVSACARSRIDRMISFSSASLAERSCSDAPGNFFLRLLRIPLPVLTFTPPCFHVIASKCFHFSSSPLSAYNISGPSTSSGSPNFIAASCGLRASRIYTT
jgi:hypothetical protein